MAIIEITHLTKKYQNKIILNDINLTINQGDRIAIVGPNGNGKTTLCEIIAGLRPYSSGELHYVNPKLIIGMQLQEAKFSKGITGWDLCRFYLKYYNRAYSIEQLEYIFITLNVSGFINKPLNNLSGGQQQRINILLALIHQPELVILDELATGLDLESRTQIYQFVASQLNPHNTLLLVTHTMNEVEMFCTDLLFLYQGRITQRASVKDIIEKYQSVENYVKLKFSEYKLNQEREGMLLKLQGDRKNEQ